MKILHTVSGLDPKSGGPTRSVSGICRELVKHGAHTTLFSHSNVHQMENPSGVFFRTGMGTGVRHAIRDSLLVIAQVQPELVHIHGLWMPCNHVIAAVARKRRVPIIFSPRGMLEPWALDVKNLKKRLAMMLYQRRDLKSAVALHATAEAEAAQFRLLGFKQPIIVLPNGVDFPGTMPPRRRRTDGKRTALFLSRIHPKKGLKELVDAWARVKRYSATAETSRKIAAPSTVHNWHFEYAGPDYDGHLAAVQKRIRNLEVDGDFTYLGNLDDTEKWAAYRRADLFVLPTYSENFGIVVAEALAAGIPVLTTTGAPWRALIEHRCGWWIEPGVTALTNVLLEVLQTKPDALAAMGERGRQFATETFAWESIAADMGQAYEWIVRGGKLPPCVQL